MITEFQTRAAFPDYQIDGQLDPTLSVVRGQTYVFQRDDAGHALFIKASLGTGDTGRYDKGIENNGIREGSKVYITKGKLSNFTAIFLEKSSNARSKILISLLNNEYVTTVENNSIERIF